MTRDREYYNSLIKRGLYSLTYIVLSSLYPLTNKLTGRERELTTALDNMIPFNKYFIYPYVYWYLYVAAFFIYFLLCDEENYYKMLISLNVGVVISYMIYIIFPTTVPRPNFDPGGGLVGFLFKFVYSNDNPYNCLPSIHVLNTMTIAIYVQKDKLHLSKTIKILSIISAILIIYSTFAIKQHVVLDAIAGTALSFGIYGALHLKPYLAKKKSMQEVSNVQ